MIREKTLPKKTREERQSVTSKSRICISVLDVLKNRGYNVHEVMSSIILRILPIYQQGVVKVSTGMMKLEKRVERSSVKLQN